MDFSDALFGNTVVLSSVSLIVLSNSEVLCTIHLDVEKANFGAGIVDLRRELLSLFKIRALHVTKVNDRDGGEISLDGFC